ncbi:MAG: hypothetical protein L0229_29200 [Blastocatellia bacterium]|nr:hypothetical protein [Blastocatellia bacterium]
MKRSVSVLLTVLIFSFVTLNPQPIDAKGFKRYRIKTKKATVDFVDENFGNFGEKCNILFLNEDGSRNLFLRVWRELEPDQTAPALNIVGIRIYGYNRAGNIVYDVDIDDGFKLNHNEPGEWIHQLEAIPKKVKKVTITFSGYYQPE